VASDFVRQISRPFTTRLALVFASWADENMKIKSGDHFLAAVLRGRKQFVKGGQSDLDELVGK
jgi:hypothetical protein